MKTLQQRQASAQIVGQMRRADHIGEAMKTLEEGGDCTGAWVRCRRCRPGNYCLEIDLGTALLENNVNDAMSTGATVRATRNIGRTESGKHAHDQVKESFRPQHMFDRAMLKLSTCGTA